jgi:sacsin
MMIMTLLISQVYNWTDSPAIVSLERLLILDPHEEWSPGGPLYDFVEDAEDPAIQNHMAAFQSVMENPAQQFEGTIIRIPLRTQEQAMNSDISDRETTVLEVREVLNKFATEFGNSGLLFMRNIAKVAIDSTSGISISIEVVDREDLRE